MAVGGLVVTFSENEQDRAAAQALLVADPRIEVGPSEGLRQAVVAETDDTRSGEALSAYLLEHPGIVAVDVAFVGGFDADASSSKE